MAKRCSKCILPSTYPGIIFREDGVCNYCRDHKEFEPLGEDKLLEAIRTGRPKNSSYDCVLAFSGGRDSTYALWYAVKKLNLKILAMSIDNGFVPEHTVGNISRAVQIVQCDHMWVKHDLLTRVFVPVLKIWLKRPSPALVSLLCLGCRHGMFREFYKFGRRTGVPLFLGGGGEPEQSFATGFFSKHSSETVRKLAMIAGMAGEIMKNPSFFMHPYVLYRMAMEYAFAYFPLNVPKMIYCPSWHMIDLFNYLPYDEEEIVGTIKREMAWESYSHSKSSWRSDCKIAVLKNVFYYSLLRFSKNDELLSNMIRKGLISREDSLSRVKEENQYPDEFLEEFSAEIGVPAERLRGIKA